jgi:hypothetical protein
MTTPKDQLQEWFQFLQDFQVACEQVSSIASNDTLLAFANDTITADLPTADEQSQFLIAAQNSTQLTITSSDITASASFEALLETVLNPLSMFVLSFIKSCAASPYGTMGFTDFAQQLLSAVFPAGTGDPAWQSVQNGLTSSIPAACYSATQQSKVKTLVIASGKKVQDLVNLISTLG